VKLLEGDIAALPLEAAHFAPRVPDARPLIERAWPDSSSASTPSPQAMSSNIAELEQVDQGMRGGFPGAARRVVALHAPRDRFGPALRALARADDFACVLAIDPGLRVGQLLAQQFHSPPATPSRPAGVAA